MSETTNKLTLKFTTEGGNDKNVILNYANPELLEDGGASTVQSSVEQILELQPFDATLASFDEAVFTVSTETTILTADDLSSEESSDETEA